MTQKMEKLQADFVKKLAILEEQYKSNLDLAKNQNKAIVEKLMKEAEEKANKVNEEGFI
jgi:ribosomal protein S17E